MTRLLFTYMTVGTFALTGCATIDRYEQSKAIESSTRAVTATGFTPVLEFSGIPYQAGAIITTIEPPTSFTNIIHKPVPRILCSSREVVRFTPEVTSVNLTQEAYSNFGKKYETLPHVL